MKKQKLSYSEISSLCLELSLFLHAGTPSGGAFMLLAEEADTKSLKETFVEMGKLADEGAPLSDVFENAKIFPKDVYSMLRVGEQTGKSEETLVSLSEYYDRLDSMDKQMRTSILYPSVLMLVMLSVVILLLTYVIPIFSDVYASLGGGLTGIAAVLLSFGNILKNAIPLLCVIAVFCVIILILFSCSQIFRSRILGIGGKSFKGISKKISTARFANALSMAISSGLSPEEAIEKAGSLISSLNAIDRCKLCSEKISNGISLADALHQSDLLPAPECRLLALGFKGGNADAAAKEIARRLDRDADQTLENTVNKAEPLMVIVSSLLIGVILLSVMLPLTHIMSSIG